MTIELTFLISYHCPFNHPMVCAKQSPCEGAHGGNPLWVFTLDTRNCSEEHKSKGLGSVPFGRLHCVAELRLVGWVEVSEYGDEGKQLPPLPSPHNLYPPLTPMPRCVAEIRARGQSPIHRHPEYFKVKPQRLTKKKVLLIKGFPAFPRRSDAVPLRCTQAKGAGKDGSFESFTKFSFGFECLSLRLDVSKSSPGTLNFLLKHTI